MIKDLSKWMDEHSKQIDEFENNDLVYVCDDASRDARFDSWINEKKEEEKPEWNELIINLRKTHKNSKNTNKLGFGDWLIKNNEYWKSDFELWFTDKHGDDNDLQSEFLEHSSPDDYYPIWNTVWQFPSSYSVSNLNCENIPNLIFFDYKEVTYVGLTACGMDISPSLFYVYFVFSDLALNKKDLLKKIYKQPSWFSYVVGDRCFENIKKILKISDKKLKIAEKTLSENLKTFDESLRNLSEMRDKKQTDQFMTGLLAMMTYTKSRRDLEESVSKI